MTNNMVACPVCGKMYTVYNDYVGDQSLCYNCSVKKRLNKIDEHIKCTIVAYLLCLVFYFTATYYDVFCSDYYFDPFCDGQGITIPEIIMASPFLIIAYLIYTEYSHKKDIEGQVIWDELS